jgi:hypothetical protein
MTDTILPGYPSVRRSDWSKALAEYKDACNAMRARLLPSRRQGKICRKPQCVSMTLRHGR